MQNPKITPLHNSNADADALPSLQIGNICIEKSAALAPMAGVSDRAFRTICKQFGAAYCVAEMASATALCMSDKKTARLLAVDDTLRPMALQLFGNSPEMVQKACETAIRFQPDILDLNMGCPAPKITANNSGSALMKDIPLAGAIIRAVKKTAQLRNIPVTVKFRSGWDSDHICAVEFAKMAQDSGADAITIHPRTRMQMYAGQADWEIIGKIKQAVHIPVIGNGDITSAADAAEMYKQTGCDLVMVGRGAYGNPWIFSQIRHFLRTGTVPCPPNIDEKIAVMRLHMSLMCEYKGEFAGMKEARKHTAWYVKNAKNAAALRRACSTLKTWPDFEQFLCLFAESADCK